MYKGDIKIKCPKCENIIWYTHDNLKCINCGFLIEHWDDGD